MADVIARSHGGDGGNDPPRRPPSIPSQCQSVPARAKRRSARSLNMRDEFRKNNNQKFRVVFSIEDGTYNPVGHAGMLLVHHMGNEIGRLIPMHYPGWDHVPEQYRNLIWPRVEEFFDLNEWRYTEHWTRIWQALWREMRELYKGRKNQLKSWSKNNPGKRPTTISEENWSKLQEFWESPEEKAKSERNAANRKKQQYPSLHGSSSLSQFRYEKGNPQENKLYGAIDTFKDLHTKKGKWVNDTAEEQYNQMVELRERRLAEIHSGASGSSAPAEVDEAAIVKEVRGSRRGFMKGIGRIIKGCSFTSTPAPPVPQPIMDPRVDQLIKNFQESEMQIFRQNQKIKLQDKIIRDMQRQINPSIEEEESEDESEEGSEGGEEDGNED